MTHSYATLAEIPQFTRDAGYVVTVPWRSVERQLEEFGEGHGIDLDPDFQRCHVWTDAQRSRYVEFVLRGGKGSRMVLFNQSGFDGTGRGAGEPMVLVDGKQRLEAVRRFMADEIPAFGKTLSGYGDLPDRLRCTFSFGVNALKTRAEVLQWYLDLNSGGVVHSDDEIGRVRDLLRLETE